MADADINSRGSKRKLPQADKSERVHGPSVAAATQAKQQALIYATRELHAGLFCKQDLAALDKWAAPHVVLHKDDLTIEHDVEGLQKVRTFYTALFEKYSYKHVPAVYGANAVADTSYCFAQDQQVLPKSATMAAERGNEEQPEPTNHAAMFRYQFNDDMKLTGIWLLRQLTREEMQQKVRNPAAARLEDININAYKASAPAPPADLAQRMVENADLYRDIWAKALSACDSQAQWDADLCLRPSAHIIDLVFGTKYVGLPRFKQQLHGMHKEWQVNEQSHEVALVPDDMKAFIFYTQKGVELDTSKPNTIFGIELLVYDEQPDHRGKVSGLIKEVVSARQLLGSERTALLEEHKIDPVHESMVKCS